MSDLANTLDRESLSVELPVGAFDRLLRKRDRERLRRRVAVIVVVTVLVLFGIGGAVRVLDRSLNQRPASITPNNVRDLKVAWEAPVAGPVSGLSLRRVTELAPSKWPNPVVFPPVAAGDSAYVATQTGSLFAFPLSCGSHDVTCQPTWVAHLSGPATYPPTVSGDVVYVATDDGTLEAYPVACATEGDTCHPTWMASLPTRSSSSPVVADGHVFINDRRGAQLFAFPIHCAVGGAMCQPAWVAPVGAPFDATGRNAAFPFEMNQVVYVPVVANGVVYVLGTTHQLYAFDVATGALEWIGATRWGRTGGSRFNQAVVAGNEVFVQAGWTLYAFPVDCATGGATCPPLWRGRTTDRLVMEIPAVVGDVVYAATAQRGLVGHVVAYSAHCRTDGGFCRPLWLTTAEGEVATWYPIVAGDRIYLSSAIRGFTEAFPLRCPRSGPCEPLFRVGTVDGQNGLGQLALPWNGMVFTANGAVVRAFDADCGTRENTCKPLWTWTAPAGIASTPVIAGGELVIATSTGEIFVLTPGGRS